jgi:hypothetical protein
MTEVESYDGILFRVETGPSDPGVPGGVRWLAVRDKFAPAWYVPAEYRGEPALRLVPGTPRETTPTTGGGDGVSFGGRAVLLPDGSAQVQLTQRFEGKAGISIRGVLDKVPGAQLHDFLESALVGRSLPGAKVRTYAVVNKEDPAAPLELRIEADVPALARQTGTGLALAPIFPINLNELAALPERQTPLLLKHAFHVEVHFEIVPPAGLHPQGTISPTDIHDGERTVAVHDSFKDGTLLLDRVVDIPAGRVQPGPEYARFLRFIHDGDGIVERQVSLRR